MKVFVGACHEAVQLKDFLCDWMKQHDYEVVKYLQKKGIEVIDCGTYDKYQSCDI